MLLPYNFVISRYHAIIRNHMKSNLHNGALIYAIIAIFPVPSTYSYEFTSSSIAAKYQAISHSIHKKNEIARHLSFNSSPPLDLPRSKDSFPIKSSKHAPKTTLSLI